MDYGLFFTHIEFNWYPIVTCVKYRVREPIKYGIQSRLNLETVSGSFQPSVVSVESFRLESFLPIFGLFALERSVDLA